MTVALLATNGPKFECFHSTFPDPLILIVVKLSSSLPPLSAGQQAGLSRETVHLPGSVVDTDRVGYPSDLECHRNGSDQPVRRSQVDMRIIDGHFASDTCSYRSKPIDFVVESGARASIMNFA